MFLEIIEQVPVSDEMTGEQLEDIQNSIWYLVEKVMGALNNEHTTMRTVKHWQPMMEKLLYGENDFDVVSLADIIRESKEYDEEEALRKDSPEDYLKSLLGSLDNIK
jgi:hypothetical protein